VVVTQRQDGRDRKLKKQMKGRKLWGKPTTVGNGKLGGRGNKPKSLQSNRNACIPEKKRKSTFKKTKRISTGSVTRQKKKKKSEVTNKQGGGDRGEGRDPEGKSVKRAKGRKWEKRKLNK